MIKVLGLVAVLGACLTNEAAAPDAAPISIDAPSTWLNAFDLVDCSPSWSAASDKPVAGVKCNRACADYTLIGAGGLKCSGKAQTHDNGQINDVFQCTDGTSTVWNGFKGCCLVQPDFAHLNTDPPLFAICDTAIP